MKITFKNGIIAETDNAVEAVALIKGCEVKTKIVYKKENHTNGRRKGFRSRLWTRGELAIAKKLAHEEILWRDAKNLLPNRTRAAIASKVWLFKKTMGDIRVKIAPSVDSEATKLYDKLVPQRD